MDNGRPPPYPYGGEYYPDERRKGGNIGCRCICCCYCTLFFLVLIVAAVTLFLFIFFDPKEPIYKFESLDVKEFGFHPNSNINTDLILTVKADNPNKKIGFMYDEGSSINVTYGDTTICSGKIPSFEHGVRNITMLQIELTGKEQLSKGLYDSLQNDEKHGKVPFSVLAKVPFKPIFVGSKYKQFTVLLHVPISVYDLKQGKISKIEQGKIDLKFVK